MRGVVVLALDLLTVVADLVLGLVANLAVLLVGVEVVGFVTRTFVGAYLGTAFLAGNLGHTRGDSSFLIGEALALARLGLCSQIFAKALDLGAIPVLFFIF